MFAFLLGFPVVGMFASTLDPAWALPINTVLILLQMVVAGFFGRRISASVADVHTTAVHGAAASASAAQAAAESAQLASDAARVAKELGGILREVHAPVTAAPTAPTVPTPTPTDTPTS